MQCLRVGKSAMKNHVIRAFIIEQLPLLQQDRERVPLLSLMPRPPLSGYFNWKDFFQDGLVAFDEPLIDHKIARDHVDDEEPTGLVRSDGTRIKRKPPEGTKDALRQSFETATKRSDSAKSRQTHPSGRSDSQRVHVGFGPPELRNPPRTSQR